MVFRLFLAAAVSVCALTFFTGCQQKSSDGKTKETVENRAEESQKIINESIKRVHDSISEAKKQAQTESKAK